MRSVIVYVQNVFFRLIMAHIEMSEYGLPDYLEEELHVAILGHKKILYTSRTYLSKDDFLYTYVILFSGLPSMKQATIVNDRHQ